MQSPLSEPDRVSWRQRLQIAYPWACPVCKTSLAEQEKFEWQRGFELTRHSECGHVIMYRSGGAEWVRQYVAQNQPDIDQRYILDSRGRISMGREPAAED